MSFAAFQKEKRKNYGDT